MKATNKFGIHFKIRSERVKEGKAPVFVGIAVDGDKSYMALKKLSSRTYPLGYRQRMRKINYQTRTANQQLPG